MALFPAALENDKAVIIDPAHDLVGFKRQSLAPIFMPKSVAVIGASERAGSVGCTVLSNLISSPFGGPVWPVNPKRPMVLGLTAYPSIAQLPGIPDLIVVTTPAATVHGIIQEAVDAGVPSGIVISAGFKEVGEAGKELERQIAKTIHGKMRLIGPNCLGVMNPVGGVNANFAKAMVAPGRLAFISQSGALGTAVLDWCIRERVGLSGFVSAGSMLDVTFGELIDHYGEDPNTDSIVIYMESIGDARSFLSAAREVAMTKPILVIKAGRTAAAAKAAASHTGSLTGSDEVLDAAFQRAGVLRVNSISELFYVAEVLAKQPRPRGPRLTILTNAGGPGVLATDALIAAGGELTEISTETVETYNSFLPDAWSHNNPVDILGDAESDRYSKALEIASKDVNTDGMLVILTPQGMTNPTEVAEHLAPYAHATGKPVIASWMGGDVVAEGEAILKRAGIPVFPYPDAAAEAFVATWKYASKLRDLYETPAVRRDSLPDDKRDVALGILNRVRAGRRTILTEYESKQLLSAYGIPTVRTELATTAAEAVHKAAEIGYPVVLKLHSETITHKTDVGGVKLNLRTVTQVAEAFDEIRASVTAKVGAEHFLGVTVQPMCEARRLRADHRQQHRSAIRAGAAVRHRRAAGGSVEGPGAGLPPLNGDSRPAHDGADEDLHRTEGCARTQARRSGCARCSGGALQPAGRRAALDSRRSTSTRCWLRRTVWWRSMRASFSSIRRRQRRNCRDRRSGLIPSQYVGAVDGKDGAELLIRPIRPEDETAAGAAFHEPSVGAHRNAPLLPLRWT